MTDAAQAPQPAPVPRALPPCREDLRRSLACILDAYGVRWEHIVCRSRAHKYLPARAAVYWLLRSRGWSYMQIGRFCDRDHTSVLHILRKVGRWKS